MTRAAFVAIALVLLPPSCAKMLGQKPPPEPTAEPPEPKPVPVTSATTPPVFTADQGPSTSVTSAPPPNPDLAKARAAADAKDWKKVKTILEKKARGGKASNEEAQLALDACTATKDKACVEALKAKYPALAPAPGKPLGGSSDDPLSQPH